MMSRLFFERKMRELRLQDVAERCAVTAVAVSMWERGLVRPRRAVQQKLEILFGLPARVLLAPVHIDGHREDAS